MSYVPPVYVPSREVELAHAAPRFSVGGGMTEDNSWNFTSISDVSNGAEYVQ